MVGDLAIFMVQNDLTPENIVERGETLAFPDSVVSYFKGMMGQPPCGFPKDLQRVVLKGEKAINGRPGDLLPPVDWDQLRSEIRKFYPNYEEPRSLISYAMYPRSMRSTSVTARSMATSCAWAATCSSTAWPSAR